MIRMPSFIFRKARKTKLEMVPVLRKPVIYWNNQNFRMIEQAISMPFMVAGRSKRIAIPALLSDREAAILRQAKRVGALRITQKNHKWMAQIAVEMKAGITTETGIMGVDLGIKVPAVCKTDTGAVLFAGNGRQNKFMRRTYRTRRKQLGQSKKLSAIRTLNNKEQRWMRDQDHKISRQIIDFAIQQKVGTIRMEALSGIRQSTRTSRKNNHSLHNWSFYRLMHYVAYKAHLAGIRVELVNPAYTSQTCPACKSQTKPQTGNIIVMIVLYCTGSVGSCNILVAPVLRGNSEAA